MRETLSAIVRLESAVLGAKGLDGLALRYGNLYGPGTGTAEDSELVTMARKRRLPIIGSGAGIWSFIHVDDAASATLAAIEGGEPGIYNIADDEPAPASAWVPGLASADLAEPDRSSASRWRPGHESACSPGGEQADSSSGCSQAADEPATLVPPVGSSSSR